MLSIYYLKLEKKKSEVLFKIMLKLIISLFLYI